MNDETSINTRLVEGQKKILPLINRSHRLLTLFIYYSVSILYLWMGWVVFFILWMELPPTLGLVAAIVIAIPLLVTPLMYKQMKQRYGYILDAKNLLDTIQESIDSEQVASGILSYISLLLNIINPDESKEETVPSQVRLRDLRIRSISQLIFQMFMMYLIFQNFFIPEIILLIEAGGIIAVLLNPVMVLLSAILAITLTGLLVLILLEITVRRWLKIYQGFIEWGEELERMVFSKDYEAGGSEP
ncbi:MAG: hypothetical protein ACFFEJ_11830 [Candidatus Thorarchaeota archaeon]